MLGVDEKVTKMRLNRGIGLQTVAIGTFRLQGLSPITIDHRSDRPLQEAETTEKMDRMIITKTEKVDMKTDLEPHGTIVHPRRHRDVEMIHETKPMLLAIETETWKEDGRGHPLKTFRSVVAALKTCLLGDVVGPLQKNAQHVVLHRRLMTDMEGEDGPLRKSRLGGELP